MAVVPGPPLGAAGVEAAGIADADEGAEVIDIGEAGVDAADCEAAEVGVAVAAGAVVEGGVVAVDVAAEPAAPV